MGTSPGDSMRHASAHCKLFGGANAALFSFKVPSMVLKFVNIR